jgi:hypothetical protein
MICNFYNSVSYTAIYIRGSTSHKSHNTCITLGFAIIVCTWVHVTNANHISGVGICDCTLLPKHKTKMQLVNLLLSMSHSCLSGLNKLEASPDNGWYYSSEAQSCNCSQIPMGSITAKNRQYLQHLETGCNRLGIYIQVIVVGEFFLPVLCLEKCRAMAML